jgi:hypothetical protein
MRRAPENGEWVTACESPCDQQMPLNNEYRIAGSGVTQSGEFTLDGKPGQRVVITANVGTTAGLTAGLIAAGVGLLVVITGFYVIVGSVAANCTSGTTNCTKSSANGGTVVGVALVIGGLGAIIVGGIIALNNAHSGQTQEVQVRKNALAERWFDDLAANAPREVPTTPFFHTPIFSRSF